MNTQKKHLSALLIVFLFFCLFVLYFSINQAKTAYASRSSLGTNTEDEWAGAQTTVNLISVNEGSLTDQGWHIHNQVNGSAIWYKDANLDTADYGWGIQATGSSADIGNKDYSNGVWFRITLSEADRIKANKGDLTVSASSLNYRQATAAHYVSLKLFFDDASDTQIKSEVVQKEISSSAYRLNITDYQVPANTASIRYYVSNWGSLAARPFIGGLTCTLTDKTAPKEIGITVDKSGIKDKTNNIAIKGDILKYYVEFNEKISVNSYGTAELGFNGSSMGVNGIGSLITENGKSKVCYKFTLPKKNSSGTVKIYQIVDLKIKDEAGNEYTYTDRTLNTTGANSLSVTYYKDMGVTANMQNLVFNGASTAIYGTEYAATLTANTGYDLPDSIAINVGGTAIATAGYTYNKSNGAITIKGNYIANDISITAKGVAKKTTVTFDMQKGSGGTPTTITTYDADMPRINIPLRSGYTFNGYYSAANGQGKQYYNAVGESVRKCDFSTPTVLYAKWTANTYTVKYDANRPSTASGAVTGSTSNSSHVYDTEKTLTTNGYSLVGWTFKGWAENASGSVKYANGATVKNLTPSANGTVTLYAVWTANTYNVKYDANRPSTASGTVTGSTANSIHTYDTEKTLTTNGYSLVGWIFKGWAENASGSIKYANGATVKNLTPSANGTVTLYAMWTEKEYSLSFDTDGGNYVNSVKAKYDNSLPSVTPPTRKGYNFDGYFSERNGAGVKYYDEKGISTSVKYTIDGDATIYAGWSAIKYNIELYNAGAFVRRIENVCYGELILPSAEETGIRRDNYTFVGWNLYEDQNWSMYQANVEYNAGLATKENETIILYAAWLEKNVYSINFDANGGVGAPTVAQAHDGETIVLSKTVPSRENFTFVGWATELGVTVAEYLPNDEFTMGSGVVTLYAVWKRNPSLSYDLTGGTSEGTIPTLYPVSGEKVVVTAVIPVLKGHIFVGWSAEREESATVYRAGEEFTMPDADAVLYAVWEKAEYVVTINVADGFSVVGLNDKYYYEDDAIFEVVGGLAKVYVNGRLISANESGKYAFTVTSNANVAVADNSKLAVIYSANGGTNAPWDNATYAPGARAEITDKKPDRLGYTFTGWATTAVAENAEYTAGEQVVFSVENVVLYAVWRANEYTVSYKANGGEGNMSVDTFSYGTSGKLRKNAFEKTGHTFSGWAVSENGSVVYGDEAIVSDLCAQNNGNVDLYAVWERTITEIKFFSESGTDVNAPVSVAYGDLLSAKNLVAPTRGGYTFAGYGTQRDGTGELIFDADLNVAFAGEWEKNVSALTVYPRWTPISYTVVYINGQVELGRQAAVYGVAFDLNSSGSLGITAAAGWHFAGWSTVPSGQTVVYNDGQTISDALTNTDGDEVSLFAVFKENEKFSVVYHANGGSNAPVDNKEYFVGETVSFGNVIPKLDGYIFGGWSYDPNGTAVDFPYENGAFSQETVEMPEGGLALYAAWKEGDTMQAQINRLKNQSDALAAAIKELKTADDNLSARLATLTVELNSAKTAISTLDEKITETNAALNDAVTELKGLLSKAETDLKTKIDKVQTNLNTAVSELNKTINDNKSDIESKLTAVDTAYKAANAIISGNLTALDEKFTTNITALDTAYKAADVELQTAIDKVQTNLNTAMSELKKTINDNKSDVESKLSAVDTAYKAANAVLRTDFQSKDAELEKKIAALEKAYANADDALLAGIRRVQENLDAAKRDLEKRDNELEEKINALQTESEKNASIYKKIFIVLSVVLILLISATIILASKKNSKKERF